MVCMRPQNQVSSATEAHGSRMQILVFALLRRSATRTQLSAFQTVFQTSREHPGAFSGLASLPGMCQTIPQKMSKVRDFVHAVLSQLENAIIYIERCTFASDGPGVPLIIKTTAEMETSDTFQTFAFDPVKKFGKEKKLEHFEILPTKNFWGQHFRKFSLEII